MHPLAQVLIYALILSQIMAAKLPEVQSQYAYPIYLLSGIAGWTLFSEILSRLLTVFIDNGNLLKKMAFPKLSLPLITIGSAIINFILLFLMMFIVFAFLGHMPVHALQWLPILILLTVGLATGMGLFLGILNVFIRDIGQVMTIILQFWFWLTPIVYMVSVIPEKYHWFIMLNPMTAITMGYHNILLYDKAPDFTLLLYPIVLSIVFLGLSMVLFLKANEEMADVL
jgi:lipopolysaccharide transport system permease protein